MQKVMLKTRIANKPKYLWGVSDLGITHTAGGVRNSTLTATGPIDSSRGAALGEIDAREATKRNLAFSERERDSLYQAEDSARSKGLCDPTTTIEEIPTPFSANRGGGPEQKVLSQQNAERGSAEALLQHHPAQLKTAKNADVRSLDPKLTHLAKDWGFHQDAATLGSIMSDKTQRSKILQGQGSDYFG